MTAQVVMHPALARRLALQKRIEDAAATLAALEDLYAALRDGTRTWDEWDPELTCLDRQDAAVDDCGTAMDAARAELAALEAQLAAPGGAESGETR